GAAQKREGAVQHAPVADRHELGQPPAVRRFENADWVAVIARRLPVAVALAWGLVAQSPPNGSTLATRRKGSGMPCLPTPGGRVSSLPFDCGLCHIPSLSGSLSPYPNRL